MTPSPMRTHSATLTLNLTCSPLRKKTGNAAHIRSVMIEKTIESQFAVLSSQKRGDIPPWAITTFSITLSLKQTESTPISQYAFSGRQIPRKRHTKMVVNSTKAPMTRYIAVRTFLESTMRRRNRQMLIFVNISVMKVWIQSAQPSAAKRRLCSGWR